MKIKNLLPKLNFFKTPKTFGNCGITFRPLDGTDLEVLLTFGLFWHRIQFEWFSLGFYTKGKKQPIFDFRLIDKQKLGNYFKWSE